MDTIDKQQTITNNQQTNIRCLIVASINQQPTITAITNKQQLQTTKTTITNNYNNQQTITNNQQTTTEN